MASNSAVSASLIDFQTAELRGFFFGGGSFLAGLATGLGSRAADKIVVFGQQNGVRVAHCSFGPVFSKRRLLSASQALTQVFCASAAAGA